MCSNCSNGGYYSDKIVRPCHGDHRYIWDSRREFQFCESCFVEKKAKELIDYLTYTNYKANRGYTPEVTPEQWEKVYGPSVYAMEERYQAEKAFARMEEAYWDGRANT